MNSKSEKISTKLKEVWRDENSKFHSHNRRIKLSDATKRNFAEGTELRKEQISKVKNKWECKNSKYNSIEYRNKLKENSGKRYAIQIDNNEYLCSYGCGLFAKYYFPKNGKYCCEKSWQSCPYKRKESSTSIKKQYKDVNSWFYSTECSELRRKRMLDGGALQALRSNNTISKPQLILYNICQKIFPYVVLEYPCLNYKIDIVIPTLNLAIEYDGSYFHRDKEFDLLRQQKLENEGWIFIRYKDYIPTKEKLFNDSRKILEIK